MKAGKPLLARLACTNALLGLAIRPERYDLANDVERAEHDDAGTIPQFIQGEAGASKCPSLHRLIAVDYECEEAAEKLELTWGGVVTTGERPPGCEAIEGRVEWNNAEGGPGTMDYREKRQMICMRMTDLETVYHLEPGNDQCVTGVGVPHWDCNRMGKLAIDATETFTPNTFAYRPGGWPHIPYGCSVHNDGTIQFNHLRKGKNKGLHQLVCREFKETCHDVPEWKDVEDYTCSKHIEKGWCDRQGYGPNWKDQWGLFEDWRAPGGYHAGKACCACGRDPRDEAFNPRLLPLFKYPGTQPYKDCDGDKLFNLTNPNWKTSTPIESPRFIEQCSAACLENEGCNYLVLFPTKTCMGCNQEPDTDTKNKVTVIEVSKAFGDTFLAPRRGANGCPSGSAKPSSAADCDVAASALGYTYKGEKSNPRYPGGCITNDKTRMHVAKAWWNPESGGGDSNKFLLCKKVDEPIASVVVSSAENADMFNGSQSTRPVLLVFASFVIGIFVIGLA